MSWLIYISPAENIVVNMAVKNNSIKLSLSFSYIVGYLYFRRICFFQIIKKREPIALLKLSSWPSCGCSVLWLFFTVPWLGLQCVIVAFPCHSHLLFYKMRFISKGNNSCIRKQLMMLI